MRIFSYIFYSLSKIYRAGIDKRDPDVYARGALICLLILNVITVMKLLDMNKEQTMLYGGIIISILLILSFVLFNSKTLKKIDERWDNEPKPRRMVKQALVMLYAVSSIGIFIYVSI